MTGERTAEPMSELGHSRRIDRAPFTFGLPRLADILRVGRHVLKVPEADLLTLSGAKATANSQPASLICLGAFDDQSVFRRG